MAKIRINGTEYDLYMGLWAMEQIEKEYGDLKTAMETFRKQRKVSMIRFMFTALANNGRKRVGRPADIRQDVLDGCNLADLEKISMAMRASMDEAVHTETVGGGEADDEGTDALAAEYDEKNG